jgi:catechol 2,3-dioxygenase-like lactoylglutathione lyase family enzyme
MDGHENLLELGRYVHAGRQRAKSFTSRIEISTPGKSCQESRPVFRQPRFKAHDRSMAKQFRLSDQSIIGFVATSDPDRAKKFYRDTLGLPLVSEEMPFALVFEAHGTMLRVTIVEKVVFAGYTVLGWQVPNIVAAAKALSQAGVRFERYSGMQQDELGIWSSPGGASVAWFKDPDGNTLSISQH